MPPISHVSLLPTAPPYNTDVCRVESYVIPCRNRGVGLLPDFCCHTATGSAAEAVWELKNSDIAQARCKPLNDPGYSRVLGVRINKVGFLSPFFLYRNHPERTRTESISKFKMRKLVSATKNKGSVPLFIFLADFPDFTLDGGCEVMP